MADPLPERVSCAPVVERVNGDLCDDVSEGHDKEGEKEEDNCVEESVEGQGEQDDNIHTQHHSTQLQLFPVYDVQDWKEERERGGGGGSGRASER